MWFVGVGSGVGVYVGGYGVFYWFVDCVLFGRMYWVVCFVVWCCYFCCGYGCVGYYGLVGCGYFLVDFVVDV